MDGPSSPPPPIGSRPTPSEFAPRPSPARRPRYLAFALVVSLLMGAGLWTQGCGTLDFYRGGVDPTKVALDARIHDEANRARVDERYENYVAVADAARNRVVPLASAIFVLGTTMLVLSALGLGGRNTRRALVQVVSVQAAVVFAQYHLTRDVRTAALELGLEGARAQQQEALGPEGLAAAGPRLDKFARMVGPLALFLQTSASGLILLALTRRRSREFFDVAANPAEEGQ